MCAPWQFVHVGADAAAAPVSALPWMLSWNWLTIVAARQLGPLHHRVAAVATCRT
jgi:hypothetical protein